MSHYFFPPFHHIVLEVTKWQFVTYIMWSERVYYFLSPEELNALQKCEGFFYPF